MDFIYYKTNTFRCPFTFKAGIAASFCNLFISTLQSIPAYFFFVLLFCLLSTSPSYAENKSILIITDNSFERTKQISLNLEQHFINNENISVKISQYQNISLKQIIDENPALIITLGSKASKLASSSSIPTLHTLISENSLKDLGLCAENNCTSSQSNTNRSYAIYLDQPISRQLNFITLLLPDSKKIGVLTANFSFPKLEQLQAESTKRNLVLKTRQIENGAKLSRQLNQLIGDIDVLFTLPDPLIHNRNNIPYLLLSTYRHNIPVIGFSKAYVNAGAIAAIYSSSTQITKHIHELATEILFSSEPIKFSSFPAKYFSIAINKRVARSLELHLPDTQIIKSKLIQLEK